MLGVGTRLSLCGMLALGGTLGLRASVVRADVTYAACTDCAGKGSQLRKCPKCGGHGKCVDCGGTGKRYSSLKGSSTVSLCLACTGTGVCRKCGGTGKERFPCPTCRGSGQVEVVPPAPDPVAKSPDGRQAVGRRAAPRRHAFSQDEVDSSMGDYVSALRSIQEQVESQDVALVAMAEVAADPNGYRGKAVRSFCYLDADPGRTISVSESENGSGRHVLIPSQGAISGVARRIFKAYGSSEIVMVTFGVVSADNWTMFDIAAVRDLLTPRKPASR